MIIVPLIISRIISNSTIPAPTQPRFSMLRVAADHVAQIIQMAKGNMNIVDGRQADGGGHQDDHHQDHHAQIAHPCHGENELRVVRSSCIWRSTKWLTTG